MANIYRRPLIYIPKKKIIQAGEPDPIAYVGIPQEFPLADSTHGISSDSAGSLHTFWNSFYAKRTNRSPSLVIDNYTMNYAMAYTSSAARVFFVILSMYYANSTSVQDTTWLDPRGDWDSVLLNNIYVFFTLDNTSSRPLFKVESPTMNTRYRMLTGATYYNIGSGNSRVKCVHLDGQRYNNLITSLRSGTFIDWDHVSTFSTYVMYSSKALTNDELDAICKIYGVGTVTAHYTITIGGS